MIDILMQVMGHMSTANYWIAFSIGLAIATVIGLIPGLGAVVMMAIAFPIVIFTFQEPAIGIVMLAVITGTGNTFDSIPAQLMGITTGGTQVTFLEGHQLTRKGLAAYSLGAVYAVSAIGGIVGAVALLFVMQIAKPLIIALSYSELAVLALFGLSMVAVLSKGAMLKGLASAAVGVFLGTVGLQTFTNTERFIFGAYDLRDGLPLVALIAGLMAIPEMLDLAAARKPVSPPDAVVTNREVFRGFKEGLRNWRLAVKHSILGVLLGALPGTGGSFVTWMSYGIGIAGSKDKSEFGKGSLKGLMFAESAENSKEGGQAIPSLALGVPGSTGWALVIAALLAYGISPGPQLVDKHSDIIWLIVVSFALANLIVTLLALLVTRQMIRLTLIPFPAIIGTIMPIVVLGAFFADPIIKVIPIIFGAAILGLLMKTFKWPRPPLILGLVLAAPIEENLFTAISMFGAWGVITRPITIIMLLVGTIVVWRLLRSMNRTESLMEERLEVAAAQSDEATALLGAEQGIKPAKVPQAPTARRLSRWRAEHWVALGFTVAGAYILYVSLGYSRLGAQLLPSLMGGVLAATAGAHLLVLMFSPKAEDEQVLDISMRSIGMEGARRAAFIMAGLTGLHILLSFAVGLKEAGLVFAVLAPLALMQTRSRFVAAAIAAVLYWSFATFIGDNLMHIHWPQPWFTRDS